MTTRRCTRFLALVTAASALGLLSPRVAGAQVVVRDPIRVLTLAKGASLLLVNPVNYQRYTIGDPAIAEPVVVSPTELLLNAKALGTTSLILWDVGGGPRLYTVEVAADAPGLQRYLEMLLPGEHIQVTSSGNSVTLSGTVNDPNSVERAVKVAEGTGASVIDNLVAPPAVQVLLHVRVAEVNRSALKSLSFAFNAVNADQLGGNPDWSAGTISDGVVRFFLSGPNASLDGLIQASISKGDFKVLAEPNLLTLPGKPASFLAGGEFPYPVSQSGGAGVGLTGAVTIVFKEFGVKLNFTPYIMRSGAIRLEVAPEVSSLDFANGLTINGFQVPTVLVRRAAATVELGAGQYLAMAGLLDNRTIDNVTKIPILGDLPILGTFFRSHKSQATDNELIVIVSPTLVRASDTAPSIPTGEVNTWKTMPEWMHEDIESRPTAPNKAPAAPPPTPPAQ